MQGMGVRPCLARGDKGTPCNDTIGGTRGGCIVLIEKADQELVLQHRHGKGGAGIQRRGTRLYTFKTIFGEVTVQRSRISHNYDGMIEIPSSTIWNTSHQVAVTANLRDAVCDQMSDQSAAKSRADVCQFAGDGSLLGRSTVVEILHQEGEQLIRAQRERGRAVLDGASETQLALLGNFLDFDLLRYTRWGASSGSPSTSCDEVHSASGFHYDVCDE